MPSGQEHYHSLVAQGCARLYRVKPSESSLAGLSPEEHERFISHFLGAEPETSNFAVTEKATVETVRLGDLPDLPPIDLLTIDTQSTELTILQNSPRVLSSVLVLESEVEFVPLYREQALFEQLQFALDTQGLVMHKMIDIVGRPMLPWGG
jgi:hypothetical protein